MHTDHEYTAAEIVIEDATAVVTRGVRDGRSVLLRRASKEYPTSHELARIRYGASISQSLDLPGVARVHGLEKLGNRVVVVMEDFGGVALRTLLGQRRIEVLEALGIARELAKILGALHREHVVHRNVEPSNIYVDTASGTVKLANFDIASRLSRDNPVLTGASRLEGTLAYISPEQTGRMNRAVDYRTDMYSLGVTLYEMLAGRLPFDAVDPMALVHSHIAVAPEPPHRIRPTVDAAVSSVVMKLLAKNAEDRYQTAYGLIADLEECMSQLKTAGTIGDFVPGAHDAASDFQIPEKLYGREREKERLIAIFERASAGSAEIVLLYGHSGIGKSALVNEIQRPITERRGYFTSGKFDKLHNAPHGAMIQAFQSLIRELLSESEKKIASLRKRLNEALGASGQVVIDVIPEVALIVGKQQPVPVLGPTESQNRFNLVFQRFINVFARREHPLAIFLDDLQWADGASLSLIRLLLSDPGTRHLLIIGTYRDNEVHGAHPLALMLSELRKEEALIEEIALRPLDLGDVRRMILDTLSCPDDEATQALARVVHDRTEGNPFFVNQFLTSLYTHQLLTFSADAGRWQWNLQRIQESSITDDVAGLMAERIRKLPEASQRVVRLAACIGASFDIKTLSVISESTSLQVATDLWDAVQTGLVLPVGDEYKYLQAEATRETTPPSSFGSNTDSLPIRYEFLHDRVREAAYALIADDLKKELHLRIGRLLLENLEESKRYARIFEIVNQLDMSVDLIDTAKERYQLARLNLLAGQRAKSSTAYDVALRYLEVATRLLGADSWQTEHALTFSVHVLRAECEHLIGRFTEAMARLEVALAGAATIEEKAQVHALEVIAHVSRGNHEGVRRASSAALALYGVVVPVGDELGPACGAESAKLTANLAGRDVAGLVHLAEATDPASRARTTLLSQDMVYGAYVNPMLFSLFAMRLVNESLEHGVSPGSAMGYVAYATAHGAMTADYVTAHALGSVALGLAERLDGVNVRSRVEFWFAAFVNPWRRPLRTSYPYLERAHTALMESGSPHSAGIASAQGVFLPLLGGDELQALQERARHHYDLQVRLANPDNAQFLSCFLRMTTLLTRGSIPPELEAELGEEGVIARSVDYLAVRLSYELLDMIVAFIFGDNDRALRLAESGANHVHFVFGHMAEAEFRFFRALVTAAHLPTSTPEERVTRLALFEEDRNKLAWWAENCAENFGYKYDLVRAEEARLRGDNEAAMALYDKAIEAAAEQDFTHHQAVAEELAAKFYLAIGRKKIARVYLADARYAYLRWGATAKVAALDAQHAGLLPHTGIEVRHGGEGTTGAALDLISVMKASQAISGEIVLDELLRKLMSTVLENAGAQRGLLLLKGDHEIIVEASGGAEAILVTDATVEERSDVSRAIVHYVERTRESIVLGDAANSGQFRADPYVFTARLKSILCMPILSYQHLAGVLYLENNLVTDAFTPERCRVLELLAAQAAISLENARLYDTLENRVKERTLELSSSNEELSLTLRRLKETQKQLIMQEKLASLGALTSGIAHEIKNPLNFINNFAELSVTLTADLLQEIESQKARLPADSVAMIDEIVGDLQQNVSKINQHGRRADDIVRAMLEHSRSGAGERRDIDINALLGEYTNLAYQGFRSQDTAFNVTIETAYDPAVGTILIPSQEIGRVFLNLINNACYAARAQRQRLGERFSPLLRVSTKSLGDRVEIRVRDNGGGIPPSVRDKIFNPFFTTKPPGEGTGLGLSISYEIVQSNGGTMAFDTVEGLYTEFIVTLPRRGS